MRVFFLHARCIACKNDEQSVDGQGQKNQNSCARQHSCDPSRSKANHLWLAADRRSTTGMSIAIEHVEACHGQRFKAKIQKGPNCIGKPSERKHVQAKAFPQSFRSQTLHASQIHKIMSLSTLREGTSPMSFHGHGQSVKHTAGVNQTDIRFNSLEFGFPLEVGNQPTLFYVWGEANTLYVSLCLPVSIICCFEL